MTQDQQFWASGAMFWGIIITNATGAPVASNTNIMTAGQKQPESAEDIR
jgi:catalase